MKRFYLKSFIALCAVGACLYFFQKQQIDQPQNPFEHQLSLYENAKGLSYEEIQALPKQDRPDLALLQEFEMTKDLSLGYPPVQRKLDAFDVAKQKLAAKSLSRGIQNVQWDERGPTNVGGRTRAIMFDPNDPDVKKVWAGGISGGLWYNDDITASDSKWYNIDDFMSNLSISTIDHDPANTTHFYIGTGERVTRDFRGTGIWKSTDGGTSWTHLESTRSFGYTTKIKITPNSTIIASTSNGIQRSTDGGTTWSRPGVVNNDMADLDMSSDGTLYAGNFSGDIYKSTDDGKTWIDISPNLGGQRVELACAQSNVNVIYAMAASGGSVSWMAKSINGGTDWVEIDEIPKNYSQSCEKSASQDFTRGQAWYDLILGVDPENENNVFIGGIDLYKSTDGAQNFSLISYWTGACDSYVHADQHEITFRPGHSGEALFGNDGGVHYSSSLNTLDPDFVERNNFYNVTQFYSTAMRNEPGSFDMLAGSQDNGTQQYNEEILEATRTATGGDGGYCYIDQNEPNIQITSYVYNDYWISRDGGQSFGSTFELEGGVGSFINPGDYDDNANILYTNGGRESSQGNAEFFMGRYTITEDNVNAERIKINTEGEISHVLASPYEDHTLYIGTYQGQVYKAINANMSPNATALFSTSGTISSIDVADNGNKIICTVSNYGATSVWLSTDAGANWSSIEGDLPDMPVWWGMFNPENIDQVIIATEAGVWSTDDISVQSVTWDPTNEGLANVSTRMLQYRESDGLVAAATHGRGLFTTYSFSDGNYAKFDLNKEVFYVGEEVSIIDGSRNAPAYDWDFGNGTSSTESSPTLTYTEPGKYTITLDIGDGDPISKEIAVLPKHSVNHDMSAEYEDFTVHIQNSGKQGFERANSFYTGKNGTVSGDFAWVIAPNSPTHGNLMTSRLFLPEYNFSQAGNYEFSLSANYQLEENWDGFIVEYSLDRGDSWTKLGDQVESGWYNSTSDSRSIFGAGVSIFSGNSNGYQKYTKDISFLAGNTQVAFRITFRSDWATAEVGLAIDDINISGPSSEPTVDFVVLDPSESCSPPNATFFSASSGSISTYSWNFGSGANPATAEGAGPHDVSYETAGPKTITLEVTDVSGQKFSKERIDYINVTLLQETNVSVNSLSLCAGDEGIITIENAIDDVVYQLWKADRSESVSTELTATDGQVEFNLGAINQSIGYSIYASDPNSGCYIFFKQPINFTSNERPDATITQEDERLVIPEGAESYQWYRNDEILNGYRANYMTPTTSGEYHCVVSNGACELVSDKVSISILDADIEASNFELYPNPTSSRLKFSSGKFDHLAVRSISGQVVMNQPLSSTDDELNVQNLQQGIYLLIMTDREGKVVTKKFRKLN